MEEVAAQDEDIDQEEDDSADEEGTEGVWEVVKGGDHKPLKVGVVATDHLELIFRNKETGEETTHNYKIPKGGIDWNKEEYAKKIDSWRRQLFTRKGFANTVQKVPWAPEEGVYLELMYIKLRAEIKPDDNAILTCQAKIFEAYNAFFDGRTDLLDQKGVALPERQAREKSSLQAFVARQGGPIRPIREEIKKRLKNKNPVVWLPAITDAEIAAHISSKSRVGKTNKTAAAGTKTQKIS